MHNVPFSLDSKLLKIPPLHHRLYIFIFFGTSYCQGKKVHVGCDMTHEYKSVFCLQDSSCSVEKKMRGAWVAKAFAQSPESLTLQEQEHTIAHTSSRTQGSGPCCVKQRPWSRRRSGVIVSHTTWSLIPTQLSLLCCQSRSVVKRPEAQLQVQT